MSLQLIIHFLKAKDKIQQCSWADARPKNEVMSCISIQPVQ